MQAIARRLLVATSVMMLGAACGAQPNQPLLANAPRPNVGAVAGGAAAAAAAITLADPDAASRKPEKKDDVQKKPIKVKESVPASVLDRLDRLDAAEENKAANATAETAAPADPAGAAPATKTTKPANLKLPRDPLDFSE